MGGSFDSQRWLSRWCHSDVMVMSRCPNVPSNIWNVSSGPFWRFQGLEGHASDWSWDALHRPGSLALPSSQEISREIKRLDCLNYLKLVHRRCRDLLAWLKLSKDAYGVHNVRPQCFTGGLLVLSHRKKCGFVASLYCGNLRQCWRCGAFKLLIRCRRYLKATFSALLAWSLAICSEAIR